MNHSDAPEAFERLNKVETAIASLAETVKAQGQNLTAFITETRAANFDLRSDIKSIQTPKPILGNLLAAATVVLALVGGIGASWLSPINIALENHTKILDGRGILIASIDDRVRGIESDMKARITATDSRIAHMQTEIDKISREGSGITRERLSVLEYKLGVKEKP